LENEAILSSAEVASRLGVTSQTVTRLSRNGELNYALVGKRRVYRENDVISFMRKKIYASLPQTIALLK
jgi:DNA (cytosine-5)-methyltransferase 1